jgi:RHS repeat-associated protein
LPGKYLKAFIFLEGSMKFFKLAILSFLALLSASSLALAEDPEYDPFYTKGVPLEATPPIQGIFEEVDPFSGYLKIVQTDLELPQNGGLKLKIMRYYDSAIWSRWDTSFPGIVALNRKSPLGIGWYMHMGIMRNPLGNTPVFELPDGSRKTFYPATGNPATKISQDLWTCKKVSSEGSTYRWEVTSPDGTVYTLESGGVNAGYHEYTPMLVAQVVKIQNPRRTSTITVNYQVETGSGTAMAYSYLSSITDSAGRKITFTYDKQLHQLKSIATDQRTIRYAYDSFVAPSGRRYNTLTKVTPPVGNPWKYAYEETTLGLAKMTYPTGGSISYAYTPVTFPTGIVHVGFRVVTQRSTSGRDIPDGTWTYQYAPGNNPPSGSGAVTTISGPNGMKEVYKYYSWNNCSGGEVWRVGRPMSRKLYQNDNLIESETYTWDRGDKLSSAPLQNAHWSPASQYDRRSDPGVFHPLMTSKAVTRDGKTYTTTFDDHDAYGNPETITESGDKTRTTQLTYWTNAGKNIVQGKPATEKVTGGFPGTFTTSYTYDTNGNPTKLNKYGVITKYTYATNGNLSKIIDANNRTWTYSWSKGRISKITNPLYSISRVINANGTIAKETNGRNYSTSYTYDKNLRVTKVTPPVGNAIAYSYPADSSYRKETRGGFYTKAYFDGFGRPTGTLNSKGVRTDIDYNAYGSKNFTDSNIGDKVSFDALERPIQAVHKDNKSVRYIYSGNTVTVKDEANNSTVRTYNAFGSPDEKLLVAVKDANGKTAGYNYNILGSLTTTSYGGITRRFGYNSKNFLTSESNPETGSITYGRDNVGNLTRKTDGTGTLSYSYDAINRLTKIYKGTEVITIGYDKADNRTSLTSPAASYGFVFDKANRPTTKNETILGTAYVSSYAYDGNDNLTSITYPGSRVVGYQYNAHNEVTAIPGMVSSATYNLAGQPLGYTCDNGLSSSFTYNSRYLPTGMSAGSVVEYTYDYDSRGNTVGISNELDASKDQTFAYDKLNRITTFNGAWGSGSFTYDVTGNRLTKTIEGVATHYSYASNRLTGTTGNEPGSYAYNTAGHLTSGTWGGKSHTLTYDGFNQVKAFRSGTTLLAEAGYDGDGLRIKKTADGETIVYHYDLAGNVISENFADGRKIADYVYLNGKLVAKIIPEEEGGIETWAPTCASGSYNPETDMCEEGEQSTYPAVSTLAQCTAQVLINGSWVDMTHASETWSFAFLNMDFSCGGGTAPRWYGHGVVFDSSCNVIKKADLGSCGGQHPGNPDLYPSTSPKPPGSTWTFWSGERTARNSSIETLSCPDGGTLDGTTCIVDTIVQTAPDCGSGTLDGENDVCRSGTGQAVAEEVYFYHTDVAGTPLAMSDSSMQKVWEADYKPFGEEFTVEANHENDKRFVGKEKDEETGLNYFGARYLSAKTGRFLAPDPVRAVGPRLGKIIASRITVPQRLNTYAYALNGPMKWVDPSGLIEGSVANLAKRKKIDRIAKGYNKSTAWSYYAKKDNFGPDTNKCNKFVYDVTKQAGAEARVKNGNYSRAPLASEWAHEFTKIPNWRMLKTNESPEPGDVAAYKLYGGGTSFSGHSGIIVSDGNGGTTNISAHELEVYTVPDQFQGNPDTKYRRYTGD